MDKSDESLIEESSVAPKVVYTVAEEWLNRITHIAGLCLSIVALVLLSIKVFSSSCGSAEKTVTMLFSVVTLLFFAFSVLRHFQPAGRRRLVFKKISRCTTAAYAVCSFLPLLMLSVYPEHRAWAIALVSALTVLAVLACVFNAIDVNRFKLPCLIVYLLMALAFVIRADLLTINKYAFVIYLIGTLVYAIGFAFYRAYTLKGHHAVWHTLSVIATALYYLAIYFYLLP